MSAKSKVAFITFLFAVPAFILGKQFWPPATDSIPPTDSQMPFFVILAISEAIAFGLGAAFLLLGWPVVKRVSGKNDLLTKLAFLSIGWSLINWWAHDNLHIHNGMDMDGLLKIEYGFHITLMIAGGIIAYFFFTRVLKQKLD